MRFFPPVAGGAVALFGLAALGSWRLRGSPLFEPAPGVEAIQPNTAAALAVCGAALLLLAVRRERIAALLGALVAVFSVAVFSQDVLRLDLGIDQLLVAHTAGLTGPHPGRMAPNSAVALILVGLSLVWMRRYAFVGAAFGTLVAVLASTSLLVHAAGFVRAYSWEDLSSMALETSFCLLLLGLGSGAYALVERRLESRADTETGTWTPYLVGATAALAGLLFWQALGLHEGRQIERSVVATARGVAREIESRFEARLEALDRLADAGAVDGWESGEEWAGDASLSIAGFQDFEAVQWADEALQLRIGASRGDLRRLATDGGTARLTRDTLRTARLERGPALAAPLRFVDGGRAFRIAVPMPTDRNPEAILTGVFDASATFASLADNLAPGYRIQITADGREVFRQGEVVGGAFERHVDLALPGPLRWRARVAPGPQLLALQRTGLPEVALAATALIALLTTLTVRYGELARRRAHRFEEAVEARTGELERALEANERLYEAERRARAEAQAASRAKDRFLALLGHELRNPLNSLSNALEVLEMAETARSRERMQAIVERQMTHLGRLVDDLLDISRIEEGKLSVEPVPLDLAATVSEAAELQRRYLERHDIRLEVDLPDEPLTVRADPTRLHQVLDNLLGNAAKFTDPGGTVRVRVEPEGDLGKVSVEDEGCGLTAEEISGIFEPFVQTGDADSRATGGLGLGLPIVQGLLQAQGGDIRAESDGKGKGARFTFVLPRTEAEPEARA